MAAVAGVKLAELGQALAGDAPPACAFLEPHGKDCDLQEGYVKEGRGGGGYGGREGAANMKKRRKGRG